MGSRRVLTVTVTLVTGLRSFQTLVALDKHTVARSPKIVHPSLKVGGASINENEMHDATTNHQSRWYCQD